MRLISEGNFIELGVQLESGQVAVEAKAPDCDTVHIRLHQGGDHHARSSPSARSGQAKTIERHLDPIATARNGGRKQVWSNSNGGARPIAPVTVAVAGCPL